MHLVPWDYDFTNEHFDGLFISNGPGDPALARKAIENVSQVRYCFVLYFISHIVNLSTSEPCSRGKQ